MIRSSIVTSNLDNSGSKQSPFESRSGSAAQTNQDLMSGWENNDREML